MPVAWAAGAAALVSAYGAIQQGQAAQDQANYQATIQQQQADRERQIAAANEQDYRRQQSRLMASRRAILGGAGVDAGEGSTLLVSEDMASESELQALRIRNGGEVSATRLTQQAALTRMSGENAKTGGYSRAGASLLQGAGYAYGISTGKSVGFTGVGASPY